MASGTGAMERKLAAIMIADVAGFSRLMERDESRTFERLSKLRAEVTHAEVSEHGGRIIKTTGDGFLAEFSSATAAVKCGVQIQLTVVSLEADQAEADRIRFRIGINVGDIIIDGDDVAGDGVNIAARLESMAPLDGLCVSSSVREQIRDDLGIAFQDLGEQKLKNISRPIRAFAMTPVSCAQTPAGISDTDTTTELALPDRPSIAVLPFANLSNDPEQAYFAEGLTASLTTDLSRISGLLVIASATTATFGARAVDIRQVGRDLGVRYVLQGSVQRGADKVRMNAQLVDAASGAQLWSDRFDGIATDMFALQDQITGRIAHSIGRQIIAMSARNAEKRKTSPQAADLLVRGIAAADKPQSLENLVEQEVLFRGVLALDPKNADAWARLARAILGQRLLFGNALSPEQLSEKLDDGRQAAEQALTLDPNSARAHIAEGQLQLALGNPDECARAAEAAIALDNNLALAHSLLGIARILLGEPEKAIPCIEQAMRLDPLGPSIGNQQSHLGRAHFLLRHSDLALEWLHKARASNPKIARAHAFISAAYAQKGNDAAALLALESLLRIAPNFKLSHTPDAPGPSYPEAYRKLYEEVVLPAMERAGIPE